MTALRRVYVAACAVVAACYLGYAILAFVAATAAFWPPTGFASAACFGLGLAALAILGLMAARL